MFAYDFSADEISAIDFFHPSIAGQRAIAAIAWDVTRRGIDMTTMLVAISGGHLAQLHMLAPRITAGDDVVWMTDDTAQSRSLLDGERVYHVPTRPPRDTLGVLRDTRVAKRAFAEHRIDRVVSSGAQIALSALIPALLRRVPFSYVESATRVTDLSTTGKLVDRIPTVHRYVQYPNRVSGRWGYALSVFDGFQVERAEDDADHPRGRHGRAATATSDSGAWSSPPSARCPTTPTVLWQTGSTDASGLDIDAVAAVSSATLVGRARRGGRRDRTRGHRHRARRAERRQGARCSSPRSVEHGEHIDSHQDDLAAFLSERGLAVVRQADEITYDDLARGIAVAGQPAGRPRAGDHLTTAPISTTPPLSHVPRPEGPIRARPQRRRRQLQHP